MSVSVSYFVFMPELPMLIAFIQNALNNIFVPVLVEGVYGHGRRVGGVGLELILKALLK